MKQAEIGGGGIVNRQHADLTDEWVLFVAFRDAGEISGEEQQRADAEQQQRGHHAERQQGEGRAAFFLRARAGFGLFFNRRDWLRLARMRLLAPGAGGVVMLNIGQRLLQRRLRRRRRRSRVQHVHILKMLRLRRCLRIG